MRSRDDLDIWARAAPWTVAVLVALSFFACDTVFTPESARAIPGSLDYCADRESTIVSSGSGEAFDQASAEYAQHCTGRGRGGDDQPEIE